MGKRCRCREKIEPCRRADQATGLPVPAADNESWAQRKQETQKAKHSVRQDSNNPPKATTSCARASLVGGQTKKLKLKCSKNHE